MRIRKSTLKERGGLMRGLAIWLVLALALLCVSIVAAISMKLRRFKKNTAPTFVVNCSP